ncbi:MAG TPA: TIGR03118 family protein [Chthonomonadaceae bacterium]|nr:TIGR03118 family protein [Chthonomonadaceae bacterium]
MRPTSFRLKAAGALAALAVSTLSIAGCNGSGSASSTHTALISRMTQTNLVSDIPGLATVTDPDLVNPWGVALGPTSPIWIADNGSGKATLYNGAGTKQGLIVTLPTPTASSGAAPTGQVFNSTTDFVLPNGSPALFIFSTEDGTILAWNGKSGTQAVLVADRSGIPVTGGAVYKGLALGANSTGNFLYATNFRTGQIDVFDKNFNIVLLTGNFTDPNLPSGFAPFGIQNINGDLFVTFAKQDAAMHDDVSGTGRGIIDQFDTNGNFKRRFATGSASGGGISALNSPWGMVVAPAGFGSIGGSLLVGNFGDGHINVFNPTTGALMGQLSNSTGTAAITIPGIWSLFVGNGGTGGSATTIYFTAGIGSGPTNTVNVESHGLFGSLVPAP